MTYSINLKKKQNKILSIAKQLFPGTLSQTRTPKTTKTENTMIQNKVITNRDDTLDTRDIIEYMEQLKSELKLAQDPTTKQERQKELDNLMSLKEQTINNSNKEKWETGIQLINNWYFQEFAENEGRETGGLSSKEVYQWPWYCVDWERATKDLKMDYFDVLYDDQIYWGIAH